MSSTPDISTQEHPEDAEAPTVSANAAVAADEPAVPVSAPENGVGLGIDLVDIDRMRAILARTPSFEEKVFSAEERAFCNGTANREPHYATRFAAKEAVLKALGVGFSNGIGPRDIEVKRGAKGQPRVILHGRAQELADEAGVLSIPLSLSFTHTEAVACAMVITKDSAQAMEQRVDPMKELAKQFKEARALLDDMDEHHRGDDEEADCENV